MFQNQTKRRQVQNNKAKQCSFLTTLKERRRQGDGTHRTACGVVKVLILNVEVTVDGNNDSAQFRYKIKHQHYQQLRLYSIIEGLLFCSFLPLPLSWGRFSSSPSRPDMGEFVQFTNATGAEEGRGS